MSYREGDVIDDRYRLVELIGSGGHGHVFRAEDQELSAPVAVKCLLPNIVSEPIFATRIAREARAMGVLSGTAATQILAFNRASDGTLYIVMELLEGKDLGQHLRDVEDKGDLLSVDRTLEIMEPIAETLAAAHARGIMHRDIKPPNIFILRSRARGLVRLLDFGLAKEVGGLTVTREGTITGSPHYMAPEVWAGKTRDLDPRVDVYAFGAVVFRMLAGRLPFPAKRTADLVRAVAMDPRPSLRALRPELPEAVDPWTERVLAIRPADRYFSIPEALADLREILGRPAPPNPLD